MAEFDLGKLGEYREHNQLEAKKAKGGFPGSFWETYSAFANTDGGIILLGVREEKDGRLVPEDVDAEKLEKDFWNMVNNRQKISANIVTRSMVKIVPVDGKNILVVRVPRAERAARPVYVGTDPKSGTYRRNHEGDYHCSLDEMSLMFRDAAYVTQDAKVLDKMDMTVFCKDSVKGYRNFFRSTHTNHLWNNEDDEMFLRKIGAIGIGEDGKYHPTAAGLLMFGYEYEITREFPNYFLDYQENRSLGATRWTDRIVSTSGDWSGNVFDFVIEALRRMQQGLKVPFVLKGNLRVDDTPIHKLLREAITNACVHADFYGRQGLVIQKSEDGYRLSNPGTVRISISDAIEGGISDPRNGIMLKIFSLIEFGERAGSGLSGICKRWEKVYHTPVTIEETHKDGVDRTVLTLSTGGNEQDIKAMLELYGDMIQTLELQTDQETTQKTDKTTQTAAQIDQETTQTMSETTPSGPQIIQQTTPIEPDSTQTTTQTHQKTTQSEDHATQTEVPLTTTVQEQIIEELKKNPNLSRKELAKIITSVTEDGIKYHLKKLQEKGALRRVGANFGGHWEILK
ncbi:MAG: putative DNA binding domain-containing protein [Muribaculaceae bacterium]|nr:putative DNA binding domain-containing protein [Muribaculaceae bacterium]